MKSRTCGGEIRTERKNIGDVPDTDFGFVSRRGWCTLTVNPIPNTSNPALHI
jgi:hypothetical protein